ncbi:hypothetical protein EBT31_17265 [bacterium]|nr:hypothetical protein [bacterium]
MDGMVWNLLLTGGVGVLGYFLREKSVELTRLQILLNRTREEIAREYVTKSEVHTDINRVLDRLDRLEVKLDRFMETHRAK